VQATLEAAVAGRLKILYVTPECLAMSWVQRQLIGVNVSLVCIDEAHYASETCANCRPGYLRLAKLLSQLAPSATRYVAPAAPDLGHSVMWQQRVSETSENQQGLKHVIEQFLDSSTNIYLFFPSK
jgi:superfamily II DNA helicase RecQ